MSCVSSYKHTPYLADYDFRLFLKGIRKMWNSNQIFFKYRMLYSYEYTEIYSFQMHNIHKKTVFLEIELQATHPLYAPYILKIIYRD